MPRALKMYRPRRFAPTAAMILAVAAVACALLQAQSASRSAAQPQSLAQMEAAGIKMSFEVASVKPNKSDEPQHSNVTLIGNAAPPPGGYFSATNFGALIYIVFAYDMGGAEISKLLPQMPKDKNLGRYDIEARAQGNPTRAQMQLMMQSLLADRFKLALHTETKQGPIYALVLVKPGKLGHHIQQHTDDAACSSEAYGSGALVPSPPPRTSGLDLPPLPCGVIVRLTPSVPGLVRFGGRGISLATFIKYTSDDRPVIDHTGLSGTFDFDCETMPPSNGPPSNSQPQSAGETFREAMQDQLGLKLESQTGPVTTFVLDHIEEPSPN